MVNRALVVAVFLTSLLFAGVSAAQSGVQYVYDDLGRLIAVIDATGNAATYVYDAVGNLLAIERHSSSVISILAFSPGAGAVGDTVTIAGTAFSATPSANTVTFNGTAATVSAATTTQLVVTVPTGATTGAIGVTAPSGSATSSAAFTVASAVGAPTITGFSPTAGVIGTSVSITGTNFESVPANDRTRFNLALTSPSAATTTSLTVSVPAAAGSGHLSVDTPAGAAVSMADFIVPPSPHTVADVAASGRIAPATPTLVTISTAGQIALLLFDGTVGDRVAVRGTNGMSGHLFGCDVLVSLLNTNNGVLGVPTCMESSGFIDATILPSTGTYALLVEPQGTSTGHVTLTWYDVPPDSTGPITPGGAPVTIATSPGQNTSLTFNGTLGQRVSLRGSSGTITGFTSGCDVTATIRKPDGNPLAAATCMEINGFTDVLTLPATGSYTIAFDPADAASGSLTLTLYDVPADFSSAITPGGSFVAVAMGTPGQNALLTFSGTVGDRVSLKIGTGPLSSLKLLKPDGSVLVSTSVGVVTSFLDTTVLGTTGTYSIAVDPSGTGTGTINLTLYGVPADQTGTLVAGGSPVTLTFSIPGQNAVLSFSGTAAQRVSLKINGSAPDATVAIRKADNSVLASGSSGIFASLVGPVTLPTTDTYNVFVNVFDYETGSLTLTLYDVPADQTGTITPGGASVPLTFSVPGQNAVYTFSGTTGQRVSLNVGGTAMNARVSIRTADNTVLASTFAGVFASLIEPVTLPATATYNVLVDPQDASTGTVTIVLYDVPADVTGALTVNGATQGVTIAAPGQKASLTFSASASDHVTIHATGNTIGSVLVKVLKPDGSQLTANFWSGSSFNLPSLTLPTTGTYTLVIDPSGAAVGSITMSATNP